MYSPQIQKPRVLSVSQINFYIKSLIENDGKLQFVLVTGEISNLTVHQRSGHIYLSLKDSNSVISAVMFAGNARRLKFRPENGMKIICRGRISLYEPSGRYQLYIEDMQPDGVGALALAFEQLKSGLEKKGLFDHAHKKPLPKFPKTIGVITSPTGAAVQDITNILRRRFPSVDIILAPVLVQGDSAPKQLVNAVNKFSESKIADVIIIGRGGGSAEDLWAFNDEELAYAVYHCKTPVISGVGHETDFTICDFVADKRASTPSAAAELAVPDRQELISYYKKQRQYLAATLEQKFKTAQLKLEKQQRRMSLSSPKVRAEQT
jgi:exodeoxyribonuclease VII large subunit